jgi:hypothetical protein
MRTILAMIASLLFLGCADVLTVPDPGGDSSGAPPTPPPAATAVAGLYRVESTLDLQLDTASDPASAFRAIDDLTDGPYDPATWLIDRALQEIDSDVLTVVVSAFRPLLDRDLNQLILGAAPTLLDDLVTMGRHLGEASRAFGIISELRVAKDPSGADSAFVMRHTLQSVFFSFAGQRSPRRWRFHSRLLPASPARSTTDSS